MNIVGVSGASVGECNEIGRTVDLEVKGAGFAEQLKNERLIKDNKADDDVYYKYLQNKYGDVTIESVKNDQHSIDRIGAGTSGTGNVVIAPNILEQMASDPKKAAYYEGKIQEYFSLLPKYTAELSVMGHEIHSSGIIIHPDGTVTHYCCGDLKPEVRARIEAQMKVEAEEKAERRRRYRELGEKAAEKQEAVRELDYMEYIGRKFISDDVSDTSRLVFIDMNYAEYNGINMAGNVII